MSKASDDLNEMTKALSSIIAGSIASRARMDARVAAYDAMMDKLQTAPVEVPETVGIAEEQPLTGTTRERIEGEPPVVPVRAIHNTVEPLDTGVAVYKSCTGCQRMVKSLSDCPTCSTRVDSEATPIWKR